MKHYRTALIGIAFVVGAICSARPLPDMLAPWKAANEKARDLGWIV
jgi:hypothetical protein